MDRRYNGMVPNYYYYYYYHHTLNWSLRAQYCRLVPYWREFLGVSGSRTWSDTLLRTHRLARPAFNQLSYQDRQATKTDKLRFMKQPKCNGQSQMARISWLAPTVKRPWNNDDDDDDFLYVSRYPTQLGYLLNRFSEFCLYGRRTLKALKTGPVLLHGPSPGDPSPLRFCANCSAASGYEIFSSLSGNYLVPMNRVFFDLFISGPSCN